MTCDKIPKCSRTGNRFNLNISLPMAPDRLTAQTGCGPARGHALIQQGPETPFGTRQLAET